MKVAGLIRDSLVNGVGVRDVIFLQGCLHRCEGCHNPNTWKVDGGTEYTVRELVAILSDSKNNVTISGGEPILQFEGVFHLVRELHKQGKSIWLYTGYTYEALPYFMKWTLATYVDVLVDGKFQLEDKDETLLYRGSANQRLIDLPKSLKYQHLVEWSDNNDETNSMDK